MSSPILFIDGECPLCSRLVVRLVRRLSPDRLQYASQQLPSAYSWLHAQGVRYDKSKPTEVYLYLNTKLYSGYEAILALTAAFPELRGYYRWLRLCPKFMRPVAYQLMAHTRSWGIWGAKPRITSCEADFSPPSTLKAVMAWA